MLDDLHPKTSGSMWTIFQENIATTWAGASTKSNILDCFHKHGNRMIVNSFQGRNTSEDILLLIFLNSVTKEIRKLYQITFMFLYCRHFDKAGNFRWRKCNVAHCQLSQHWSAKRFLELQIAKFKWRNEKPLWEKWFAFFVFLTAAKVWKEVAAQRPHTSYVHVHLLHLVNTEMWNSKCCLNF